MATPSAGRTALASVLSGIDGLRAHATYPGNLNAPAVVAVRRATTPDTAAGVDDYQLAARVFVPWAAGNETAQDRLDSYVQDVIDAIRADPELDGVVDSARVSTVEADELVEFPPGSGVQYLSASVVVEVLA